MYITLSLGLEYEGRHHKLIAAMVMPSVESSLKDPFVIRQDILRKKSVRPFTYKERKACKRCFVVPSQQGLAVCMKMRDGKEQFLTIDEGCHVESWQVFNLKNAFLIIYEDADGNEVKRISDSARTKWSVLGRIVSFFLRTER